MHSGGADGWKKFCQDYLYHFREMQVCILPDNDPPGEKFASIVAGDLKGTAKTVCVLPLPGLKDKEDVVEWLDKYGHTVDELQALAADAFALRAMDDTLASRAFDEIDETKVEYLYYPYVQIGTCNILAGIPGVGKSMLTCQFASATSRGYAMPDQDGKIDPRARKEPRNVVIFNGEDDPGAVIKPRLRLCDADMSRIRYVDGVWKEGQIQPFTIEHVDYLREFMQTHKPALVVLDPIQLYLGAKVDMNRPNEVRPLLTQVANLGKEFGAAMLCVAHPPKGEQSRAIFRIAGSFDFGGTARGVLSVDKDPDEPQVKSIMVHVKNNGGPEGVTQVFSRAEGQFLWCGTSEITVHDLEGPPRGPIAASQNKCKTWLTDLLKLGAMPWDEVLEQAKSEGFSKNTVYRTKEKLGIRTYGEKRDGKYITF